MVSDKAYNMIDDSIMIEYNLELTNSVKLFASINSNFFGSIPNSFIGISMMNNN